MAEGLKGGRHLQGLLAALHAQIEIAGHEALTNWGDDVQQDAQASVHVLSGYLRSHIEARVSGLQAQVGVWDNQAYYSAILENGNSRQSALPFLAPAFDRRRDITPYMRASVKRRLKTT